MVFYNKIFLIPSRNLIFNITEIWLKFNKIDLKNNQKNQPRINELMYNVGN